MPKRVEIPYLPDVGPLAHGVQIWRLPGHTLRLRMRPAPRWSILPLVTLALTALASLIAAVIVAVVAWVLPSWCAGDVARFAAKAFGAAVVGLALWHFAGGLRNGCYVELSPRGLSTWRGPIPWPWARAIPIDDLAELTYDDESGMLRARSPLATPLFRVRSFEGRYVARALSAWLELLRTVEAPGPPVRRGKLGRTIPFLAFGAAALATVVTAARHETPREVYAERCGPVVARDAMVAQLPRHTWADAPPDEAWARPALRFDGDPNVVFWLISSHPSAAEWESYLPFRFARGFDWEPWALSRSELRERAARCTAGYGGELVGSLDELREGLVRAGGVRYAIAITDLEVDDPAVLPSAGEDASDGAGRRHHVRPCRVSGLAHVIDLDDGGRELGAVRFRGGSSGLPYYFGTPYFAEREILEDCWRSAVADLRRELGYDIEGT
ncbi:MAG: hypothetical protein KF729_20930 [Sandaracinaceae bacterium]|nr:hypothetical protein [Sandaracinaceae bacterium]